jgi:hypothetical protein
MVRLAFLDKLDPEASFLNLQMPGSMLNAKLLKVQGQPSKNKTSCTNMHENGTEHNYKLPTEIYVAVLFDI